MEGRSRGAAPVEIHLRPRTVRQRRGGRLPARRRLEPPKPLIALRLRRRQRDRIHCRHGAGECREGYLSKVFKQNVVFPQFLHQLSVGRHGEGDVGRCRRQNEAPAAALPFRGREFVALNSIA